MEPSALPSRNARARARARARACACACALILAWATAGCSPAAPSPPGPPPPPESRTITEPPLAAIPTPTSIADVTLPMDAYAQTGAQRLLDYRATDLLVARCVAAAGGTYRGDAATRARDAEAFAQASQEARFGLVDAGRAARYGYHTPPGLPSPRRGIDPETLTRCMKQAASTLDEGAPPQRDFQTVSDIEANAQTRAHADRRYQEMLGKWKACVRAAGLPYQTPQDAADDPAWRDTTTASAAEIRAATTDVRCKRQVEYLGLVVALMTAYERELMTQHAAVLDRVRAYYAERARRVGALLATGGR